MLAPGPLDSLSRALYLGDQIKDILLEGHWRDKKGIEEILNFLKFTGYFALIAPIFASKYCRIIIVSSPNKTKHIFSESFENFYEAYQHVKCIFRRILKHGNFVFCLVEILNWQTSIYWERPLRCFRLLVDISGVFLIFRRVQKWYIL